MKRNLIIIILIILAGQELYLQTSNTSLKTDKKQKMENKKMELKSTNWINNGKIPSKYTCDGENISPELEISEPPPNAKSLVLIVQDPDAPMGTFVHWVMYNIPKEKTIIPEGIPSKVELEDGSIQGINDFKKIGYGGPCPPSGSHRYIFTLYALDIKFEGQINSPQLKSALHNHTIEKTTFMGTYSKKTERNGKLY